MNKHNDKIKMIAQLKPDLSNVFSLTECQIAGYCLISYHLSIQAQMIG